MSDFEFHVDDAVTVVVELPFDLSSGDTAKLQLYDGNREHIGAFTTTVDETNNEVRFATDSLPVEAGYYLAEIDVAFADGGSVTVPNKTEDVIEVHP